MINALIRWSLQNRFLVLGATLLRFGWGLFAIRRVPVDAIPDLSENQVIVFADWEGRSPREVEDQVTYPLSVNLQGLAGVRTVRATSMFGFSLITVIFEDRLDNYFARTRVLERLNYLGNVLPAGVTPRLGPDATGLGWVFQYYLKDTSGQQDLGSLRALQDYFVRYQLAAVPGLELQGNLSHEGRRAVLADESARIPAWTRLDAALRYETTMAGTATTWTLGLDNVTNKRYWKESPYQFGHVYLYPGAPRTLRLSLTAAM